MKGEISYVGRYESVDGVLRRVTRKAYRLDGQEVTEAEFLAAFPDRKIEAGEPYQPTQFKPIFSEAMAVHPKRRKEAIALAAKLGVPTHYDSMGRPEFSTRQHRRAFLHAFKLIDRSSYTGY